MSYQGQLIVNVHNEQSLRKAKQLFTGPEKKKFSASIDLTVSYHQHACHMSTITHMLGFIILTFIYLFHVGIDPREDNGEPS